MNNECLIQGTESWKEMRKTKISSTDASIICGSNPFCTPHKLWLRKMDLIPEEEVNQKMTRGTLLEPVAREWLEKQHGIKCMPKVLFKDFAMASLDGMSECSKFIVEIKCGEKAFSSAYDGNIPKYYVDQIFHQMHVADVDLAYYVAFNGETGIIIDVKRDQKLIDEMIKKEEEFYECLLQYTPPALTERDYIRRSDADWTFLSERYKNICQKLEEMKILEKEEKLIKQQLIELSGSYPTMGAGIKLSKITRKGTVDYSKIEVLNDVDLDQYRKKSTEYWTVLVE